MRGAAQNLALADFQRHDPQGGRNGRYLCPLPACAEHTDPRRHRSVSLQESTGLWNCKRCGGRGKLTEFQQPPQHRESPPRSRREREAEKQAKRRRALIRALERHSPPCRVSMPPCPPVTPAGYPEGSCKVSLSERLLATEAASVQFTTGFSSAAATPRSGLEKQAPQEPPITGGQGGKCFAEQDGMLTRQGGKYLAEQDGMLTREGSIREAGGMPEGHKRRVGQTDINTRERHWDASRLGTLQPLAGSPPAQAYLASRGFIGSEALQLLHRAGVRYAADFGRRRADSERRAWGGAPAIVFPVRDDSGVLVAGQGRFLAPGDGAKALTFGERSRGAFVTPGALERLQEGQPVALCEAPLDALSLALHGLPALALCGCSGLPGWLTQRAFGRRFYIAFDTDDAGKQAAAALAVELTERGGQVEPLPPPGGVKDWNDALQAGLPGPIARSSPADRQRAAYLRQIQAFVLQGIPVPPLDEWMRLQTVSWTPKEEAALTEFLEWQNTRARR